MPAGEEACDLDGVLVGFRPAVGEEKRVNIARRDLGQLGAQPRAWLGCHERVGIGQHARLLGNSVDHALVTVADVHAHQLAVEINEALPFRRPEVNALGAGDRYRIHFRLRRPFEQRVLLGEINNFLAAHRRYCGSSSHDVLKTKPRIHADEHGSESVLIRENPWPKDFKTCASALWPSARLPLSFLYRTLPHRGPGRASRRKSYPSSR